MSLLSSPFLSPSSCVVVRYYVQIPTKWAQFSKEGAVYNMVRPKFSSVDPPQSSLVTPL